MSWCRHCIDRGGFFSTNYKCNVSGEEVDIPSSYINNYCKYDYMASKCPYYQKEYGMPGGCFITTITCKILSKQDDDEVMQNLRKFRDNVLQENEEYHEVLKEYDTIGPQIAHKIENDENKEQIANVLYEKVLTPISKLVGNGENELAVEKYYQMTLLLINYYGLKHEYNSIKDNGYYYETFDVKKAGHGKKYEMELKKESNE